MAGECMDQKSIDSLGANVNTITPSANTVLDDDYGVVWNGGSEFTIARNSHPRLTTDNK
jgi:hypothetical protein